MGTINYGTSEFLTIGLQTMDFDEAKTSLIECYDDLPEPSDDEVYTYIYDTAGEDRLTVEQEFKKLSFSVFDVKIEPGYYEGFYIDVRFNNLYFWDEDERETAAKEAAAIKDLWLYAVNNASCCEVWPGWCTSYKDYDTTLASIDRAYNDMLEVIKKIPVEA